MGTRTLFSTNIKKTSKPKPKPTIKVDKPKRKHTTVKHDGRSGMCSAGLDEVGRRIFALRLQMLVHSCMYYELNTNIISDSEFDKRARELAKLQNEHPDISEKVQWHEAFIGWDGTTGFNLPLRDPWVLDRAQKLLEYYKQIGGEC